MLHTQHIIYCIRHVASMLRIIIFNILLRSVGTVHRLLASSILMYVITVYTVNNKGL